MSEIIKVNCKTPDGEAYTVVLTVRDRQPFIDACNDPAMVSRDGEELVAKLLNANRDNVETVERLNSRNNYQNGPNGEPALICLSPDTFDIEHFQDGLLHDGIKGEPASCKYDRQGRILSAARFSEGELIKELSQREIAAYTDYINRKNTPPRPPGP